MTTHAADYYENNAAAMKPVREQMGETVKAFGGMHVASMHAGALTTREKELIALGIGIALRCEPCIYSHVRAAVKAGADRAQILETASVAVMMSGGPGYTYLPRVVEALDALKERGELS